MSRNSTICLAGLILGCGDKGLFQIEIEESSEAVVEGTGLLGTAVELVGGLGFEGFTQMNIVNAQELQNQGVSPGDIVAAEIVELKLTVLNPADGDLSFLDSMEILVSSPDLDTVLVASQDTFQAGEQTVYFELEGINLVDYVVSESLTIETDVIGTAPENDTTIEASFVLDVGVTAQGACRAAQGE